MSRIFTVGSTAVSAQLSLKYNSRNKFSLFFWDDNASTVPTSLTGVVVTIELLETDILTTTWTATNNGVNEAIFDQASSTAQFTWDARPFRVIFTKAGVRDIVMTGEARIQR